MPSRERVEALITRVEAGAFVAAIEEFYAADASMQENSQPPRVGLPALVANERGVIAAFARISARCIHPVFVAEDEVVIHWIFDFTAQDGATRRLDELAHQRWLGDRIVAERFFYDPEQMS